MVANLDGIAFGQIYTDNSGGSEFDTDSDGTATQEDEFISFVNTGPTLLDLSGWEIWSDSAGIGAPDLPSDGLYHIFAPGTTLGPGQTIYVINEITGTEPGWAQESSQGGVESGAGGVSTNLLTEGDDTGATEGVALVNPATGAYIVFNMSPDPHIFGSMPGFPGTTEIGVIDGHSVQSDQDAGSSYQYNSGTDSYIYNTVFVPCFASGTGIATPTGNRPVETLRAGDLVQTMDHGPLPVRLVMFRNITFDTAAHEGQRPICFNPGSLGPQRPARTLCVSPQHRMLWTDDRGQEYLVPAKAFLDRPGVRVMKGKRKVTYVHLVLDAHQILQAEGVFCESFLARKTGLRAAPARTIAALYRLGKLGHNPDQPARPLLSMGQARRHALAAHHTAGQHTTAP